MLIPEHCLKLWRSQAHEAGQGSSELMQPDRQHLNLAPPHPTWSFNINHLESKFGILPVEVNLNLPTNFVFLSYTVIGLKRRISVLHVEINATP